MPRKNKSEHYVNNREFLDAIVEYKKAIAEAAEKGEPKPRITNYLGECFLKIATHLSYKPNFVNYMFRDDMICDGIENCVQSIHNFNPEKSTNPFAYFTQIIHYAFLRRIQKEKKQMEIRTKILRSLVMMKYLQSMMTTVVLSSIIVLRTLFSLRCINEDCDYYGHSLRL